MICAPGLREEVVSAPRDRDANVFHQQRNCGRFRDLRRSPGGENSAARYR